MATYSPYAMLFHLTLVQTLHGQTIQNGYYFTNRDYMNEDNLPAHLAALINDWKGYVHDFVKQFQSQELVHRSLIATTLIPHNGPIAESVFETSQGVQTFEALPSYCAACLTLRTGRGGKSNRGRSYYAGICADHCSASRLDSGLLAWVQALGDRLLLTFSATSGVSLFDYVIFSRKLGTNEGGSFHAGGIRQVKQTLARSVLATCRHRKIGIGN